MKTTAPEYSGITMNLRFPLKQKQLLSGVLRNGKVVVSLALEVSVEQ